MKLRIVADDYPVPKKIRQTAVQSVLFASKKNRSFGFIGYSDTSGANLLGLIRATIPSYIVDLRLVPKFDKRDLNRQLFFSSLESLDVQYLDCANGLSIYSSDDWRFNPQFIGSRLAELLSKRLNNRPVLFLLNDVQEAYRYADVVPGCFEGRTGVVEAFTSDLALAMMSAL